MTYLELLKSFAFWAGMKEEDVTDDATMKALATLRFNRRLDKYSGMLGAVSRLSQADDTNYTEHPFSLFDIVDEQHDYEFLTDEDGNSISDITAVMIKEGDTFRKIDKVTLDDNEAELIMSPNDKPGTPNRYLERNNTIFLDPVPDYNLYEGGKLFYKRVPSYFTTSDTTKQPGIPSNFHDLVAMGSAYDWCLVNKSNSQTLISGIKRELMRLEREFKVYQEMRNPQKSRIIPRQQNNR